MKRRLAEQTILFISFLITGHRSVYDSQILSIKKTPSIDVVLGKEMNEVKALPKLRAQGWAKYLREALAALKQLFRIPKGK